MIFCVQCYEKARQGIQRKLDKDCPDSIWLSLDGWSAETTSYIGAEICRNLLVLVLVLVLLLLLPN